MNRQVYQGTGWPLPDQGQGPAIPAPPPWRAFDGEPVQPPPPEDDAENRRRLGSVTPTQASASQREVDSVNLSLLLRRPLLVTGRPGTGKSGLAYRIARELKLGRVLRWTITSRSTLNSGLYEYDAIGRVEAANARRAPSQEREVGDFLTLGPLGTALLPYERPRVLLIDEIDKSDIDLPNDLLSVFEDGEYTIRELVRLAKVAPEIEVHTADPDRTAVIRRGRVRCRAFPMVVITSNDEREFPPAFLRRCLRMHIEDPDVDQLAAMVHAHFRGKESPRSSELIQEFVARSRRVDGLAADQLLNAVHLVTSEEYSYDELWDGLIDTVWQRLTEAE
ncbi:AAA family ATPase [Kutzneria sp. CA-103260]|uniref:AAA family ATPase n=1 Tax=Kutzneria sp. CA-103260 TaxID=2802641 RepID=UPI001BA6F27A|nr:MoxR family ATPase [Kutzneria sp. CA-103260]QUQ62447.1 ATPase AAA [Kutzneria sp. CA-103260]